MFSHETLSAAEKAKIQKPTRPQSEPPKKGGGGGGKGKTGALWCEDFISANGCKKNPCPKPHWPEDMVRIYKETKAQAKKASEASGKKS